MKLLQCPSTNTRTKTLLIKECRKLVPNVALRARCFRARNDVEFVGNKRTNSRLHYAKYLHVWVIYDNCAHYVTHLHYTVRYLLLS